jgi:hypothetical protein
VNVASYDLFSRMISQTCLICPDFSPVLVMVVPVCVECADALLAEAIPAVMMPTDARTTIAPQNFVSPQKSHTSGLATWDTDVTPVRG